MAERRTGRKAGSARRSGRDREPDDDDLDAREEPEPDDEYLDEEGEPEPDDEEEDLDPEPEPELYDDEEEQDEQEPDGGRGRAGRGPALTAGEAARAALRQVIELTAKKAEGITGVEPAEDGWIVGVEVVEDRRIPSSADILATYETTVDSDGRLLSYRRVRRYPRGRADSDGGP